MDSFWGNIFRREDPQEGMYLLLKGIPVFESLNKRELGEIEKIIYRRTYAAGEIIFHQGDPGLGMYIVAQGTVAIIYEPTGRVLAELNDGEFFGEVALLNETPRSATAQARTPCTLLCLFQPDLLDLVGRDPRLGVKVLRALAQIAGQRLIRRNEETQALRLELARLKAQEVPEPLPLHERNHTTAEPRQEPEHRTTRRGDGSTQDTLD